MATTVAHQRTLVASKAPRPIQQRPMSQNIHPALAGSSLIPTPSQARPPVYPAAAAGPSVLSNASSAAAPSPTVLFPSTSRCSHLSGALSGDDQRLERFRLAVRWSLRLGHQQAGQRRKVSVAIGAERLLDVLAGILGANSVDPSRSLRRNAPPATSRFLARCSAWTVLLHCAPKRRELATFSFMLADIDMSSVSSSVVVQLELSKLTRVSQSFAAFASLGLALRQRVVCWMLRLRISSLGREARRAGDG